jgi:hypothetical protein
MNAQELYTLADNCLKWYWEHGHKREDQYEVSRGSCLDPLYAVRDRAAAIARSGLNPRPCMALWGPSQTGKSTLLSGYLDVDGDEIGLESALTWSQAEPVRFGGELKSDGSNIVVNPYNGGADGSGCISRFVMTAEVADPAFPVEITLATDTQILHALAAGYESECQPRNKQGEEVSWGMDSFRVLMENVKSAGPPDREGFEALQRLANVLDLLIMAGIRRYANLTEQWRTLRPTMLNHPHLANRKALRDFTNELLWDSWPSLSSLCERLQAKRAQLFSLWKTGEALRCSWRLAALLLDIDAYKHYAKSERAAFKAFVDSVGFSTAADGSILLGACLERPLIQSGEDFGLFQGLVWELRLPLRKDVLTKRAPVVAAFLEKADLMDFPGVSNEHEGAKKITNDVLATDLVRGLTEVLKRGKTASIAVSRAVELDIDGFSILARAGKHPGQPKQLVSGIQSWMRAYGQKWPPQGRVMPLNLVITFCAKLVNDVCSSGIRNGLDSYFSLFAKLADLADPRVVNMFTTTYPWLMEGSIHPSFPAAKVQEKVAEIFADRAFIERFGDNRESFEQMVANGGTDYFFQRLTEQAATSRRPLLLSQRLQEACQRLMELMSPHLPSKDAAQDERNRALDMWIKGIAERLADKPKEEHDYDRAANLSRLLRRFLNIDPEELEVLPTKAIERRTSLRSFVEKQFRTWRSSRASVTNVAELGFKDAAHAQRVLAALVEAANIEEVVKFFRDNLGTLTGRRDAQDCRRFLAVKMNRELLSNVADVSTHAGDQEITLRLELLRQFAAAEDEQTYTPESSPHYVSIIKPLLSRLETIKKLQAGNRVPQSGDAELDSLVAPYLTAA